MRCASPALGFCEKVLFIILAFKNKADDAAAPLCCLPIKKGCKLNGHAYGEIFGVYGVKITQHAATTCHATKAPSAAEAPTLL